MRFERRKYLIALLLLLFSTNWLAAQNTRGDRREEAVKLIEKIAGTWKLHRILDDNQMDEAHGKKADRIKETQQKNALQILEFNPEGRYKTRSKENVADSGSYRLNEQQNILYMESDSQDITPTEWSIAFQRNLMTLEGRNGDQRAKRMKYIYLRTKKSLSTN